MIRKLCITIGAACLLLYTIWNFYERALVYDPLSVVSVKKLRQTEAEKSFSEKFKPAWSKVIHEKNLFSPGRSYQEPRPYIPPPQPVYVEPPRRPEMALRGIVLDTFGEYVAYIEIDRAKPVPMRKGDKTEENIEVVDITDRKVVLKWNNEVVNLSVDKIRTITNPRGTR